MTTEVLTFNEGSAWIYTGNASGIGTFVRSVTVRMVVGYAPWRPPHNPTALYRETGREASLDISQAYNELRWLKLLQQATGGSVIVHVQNKTPGTNASGGVWLYSGALQAGSLAGNEGSDEQSVSLQGIFQNWSAY